MSPEYSSEVGLIHTEILQRNLEIARIPKLHQTDLCLFSTWIATKVCLSTNLYAGIGTKVGRYTCTCTLTGHPL